MIFKRNISHPIDNKSKFKHFIYQSDIIKIFIVFILYYIAISIVFACIYFFVIDNVSFTEIIKFSILASFGFHIDMYIDKSNLFFIFTFLHQIISLVLSTIFTAAIVLKYFFLPKFFVFKNKINLITANNEVIISLYNSTDLFVTNCHIRIYAREESIDEQGVKSLINVNNSEPVFDKTYPFMEKHLVTRLKIKLNSLQDDILKNWFEEKGIKDRKLDLIILVDANSNRLDSSIYEVKKYKIDSNDLEKTIDFKSPNSIDLNYENFSKSEGWERFDC